MITNPLVTAREICGLSQQELATKLNVSQQYIQRLESGQSASIPLKVAAFFDEHVSTRDRRSIVLDIIDVALLLDEKGFGTTIPDSSFSGDGHDIRFAYRMYVALSRRQLPDCRHLSVIAKKSGPKVVARAISDLLDVDEDDYVGMAKAFKIHPFVLVHYFRGKSSFSLPGTLEAAINETSITPVVPKAGIND
jgi:DNA-binding XRE family transcriptional regulator